MNAELSYSHRYSQRVFYRLLGAILLIAFISYWVQFALLNGSNGLLPVSGFMDRLKNYYEGSAFLKFPTLSWISSTDILIHVQCLIGVLCGLSLVALRFIKPAVLISWFLYLSLVIVGQAFYYFQWDLLLLEVCFSAFFLGLSGTRNDKPSLGLWLLWLLLFKLMFLSGAVKLLSNDIAWRDGTALTYHYFTQPLPHTFSYFFHHLPLWFHKLSCYLMFFIELVVPFFILIGGLCKHFSKTQRLGRALHLFAALSTILLMLAVFFSGNYNFFNLLVIALCLLLIDNKSWNLIWKDDTISGSDNVSRNRLWDIAAVVVLLLSILQIPKEMGLQKLNSPPLRSILAPLDAFRTINGYGLFRVMTRSRPEVIFEGSMDKKNWVALPLKSKINSIDESPPFIAPHHPRLQWQLWFAALGDIGNNPWVYTYMKKVMEGDERATAQIKDFPFETPPQFMRALLYDYQFTPRGDENYWQRTYSKHYSWELSLEDYP